MLKQMMVAGDLPSFVGGALRQPGEMVTIDTDQVDLNPKLTPNLVEPGQRPALIPVEVAPIGPTGPYPVAPQQVSPGATQTIDGYASGPHLLVGPGSDLLNTPAADGDVAKANEADWAAFQEWRKSRDAAAAGATGVPQAETAPTRQEIVPDEKSTFDANAQVDGTIPDVVGRLDGLSAEQLEQVRDAEKAGKNRDGVNNAIDSAIAKLG